MIILIEEKEATTTVAPEPEWLQKLLTKLPQPPNCGNNVPDRIYGGTAVEVDEYGWTVLLQHKNRKAMLQVLRNFTKVYRL